MILFDFDALNAEERVKTYINVVVVVVVAAVISSMLYQKLWCRYFVETFE